MPTLEELGWTAELDHYFTQLGHPDWAPGRIARVDRERFGVWTASGEIPAELSGKIRDTSADHVCVGDWVALTLHNGLGIMHARLPRKTSISRKAAGEQTAEQALAANIDAVLLVCGLDADFNLRRIERALTLVMNSGASPIIVLNKADQCDNLPAKITLTEQVAPHMPVCAVSATTGLGLEELRTHLKAQQTFVLLGSSGVGKSTLTNSLLEQTRMQTGALRSSVEKGHHTTTHRQMWLLPNGALCIDTPGLRELGLWGSDEGLDVVFPEIEALARTCRFHDCSHEVEPGCAIQAALQDGALSSERYESWLKLRREYAFVEQRQSEHKRRQADKELGRMYKRAKEDARRRKPGFR
ncbi:MAG: ribosome small subunit-dependent GTPase A [Myxococcales bacterium]|nr:MAG: ribosome small subunit-dependent GTPase A [Myxococcales bacterium]